MAAQGPLMGKGPPFSWTADSERAPFYFICTKIEATLGNRLVAHERIFRDGARFDDTGCKPDAWHLTIPFFNNVNPFASEVKEWGGDPLDQYPGQFLKFLDLRRKHEVGTLRMPFFPPIRCRIGDLGLAVGLDPQNRAEVAAVFQVDNEDAAAAAFAGPSARAAVAPYANNAAAKMKAMGMAPPRGVNLSAMGASLELLLANPLDFLRELSIFGALFLEIYEAIVLALLEGGGAYGSLPFAGRLGDSRAWQARWYLEATVESAAMALFRIPGIPPHRTIRFRDTISMGTIATLTGMDLGDLLDRNPQVEDPDAVAPGVAITIDGSITASIPGTM